MVDLRIIWTLRPVSSWTHNFIGPLVHFSVSSSINYFVAFC